jgi:hypothetical protein
VHAPVVAGRLALVETCAGRRCKWCVAVQHSSWTKKTPQLSPTVHPRTLSAPDVMVLTCLLLLTAVHPATVPQGPQWIHGAMVVTGLPATVCATTNGCTDGDAFLACEDSTQTITNITFASYGNPSQCPTPTLGDCTHPHSLAVIEEACLGRSNCTVHHTAFTNGPSCLANLTSVLPIVMVTALCSNTGGDGVTAAHTLTHLAQAPPLRRANTLRHTFTLASTPTTATAKVSSLGYNILYCNGHRVSPGRVQEPGRQSSKRVFYSVRCSSLTRNRPYPATNQAVTQTRLQPDTVLLSASFCSIL